MEIVTVKTDSIIPYERNPRRNTEAVKYVAQSIKEFGFKQPIVLDKDNVIIAGHTRWLAAQTLGLDEVPCVVAKDLSDEQVKAYRLADNKVGEIASWDFDLLAEELADIDFDMSDFGFEVEDYETEPEPDPDAPREPQSDVSGVKVTIVFPSKERWSDVEEDVRILAENVGAEVRVSGKE